MKPEGTLLLRRRDVAELLDLEACIAAVERAFQLHAEGRTLPPGVLGVPARDGGFHIKAAGLEAGGVEDAAGLEGAAGAGKAAETSQAARLGLGRSYFAAKVNGNFFHNVERFGMPNIQGVIVLADAENGFPLAVLDSIEITIQRTGRRR